MYFNVRTRASPSLQFVLTTRRCEPCEFHHPGGMAMLTSLLLSLSSPHLFSRSFYLLACVVFIWCEMVALSQTSYLPRAEPDHSSPNHCRTA